MSTATITEEARHYIDAVRAGLIGILPEEDAEEVLQDLEAHIVDIDTDDIRSRLGTPEEFITEFRASAGLDEAADSPGLFIRSGRRLSGSLQSAATRTRRVIEPMVAPLVRRRHEITTAWIWSRGIIALLALSFLVEYDTYGAQDWLLPKNGHLVVQLGLLALATFVSVQLADARGKWWQRLSLVASLTVGFVLLSAVFTTHYTPWPEETVRNYYGDDSYFEIGGAGPDQLIGPNGPIDNIYAYDVAGNPVQVLLYDQNGNPLTTVPEYVLDVNDWDEFMWRDYEIRFVEDIHGRSVVNLYPLARFEWTETGARSAPQPPPVIGIPELPREAGNN